MPQGVGLVGTVGGWEVKKKFEIQPDLACELLTSMAYATAQFFGSPHPGALGRGQKVKYHKISITKSISKIFKPNFAYLLTNKIYKKNIRQEFHSIAWVMPQEWDLGVSWGGGGGWGVKKLFPQIQPDLVCELLT